MKKALIIVISICLILLFGCIDLHKAIFGFSMNEADPSTCDKISEIAKRDTCYNNVAPKYNDSSICEKIVLSQNKDICYSNMASKLKNHSLCEKIKGSLTKNICYDNLK